MSRRTVAGSALARRLGSRPTLDQERLLWKAGHEWVAGMDEVGRGAWAGPLSVGVAVMAHGVTRRTMPLWLRDSKLLHEVRREAIFDDVASWCAWWAVGHASAPECDRFGMTAALRLAGLRALSALPLVPDALLIDGPANLVAPRPLQLDLLGEGAKPELAELPSVRLPTTVVPIVDGDALCAAVSAASVLAKVVRDRHMRSEAPSFPVYQFDENKGYPSPAHKHALRGYGLSAIHRASWAFVRGIPWSPGPFSRSGREEVLSGT
ncbi:MAG: ribonuclease HII [Acidimicrobiales bacterium]